MRALIAERDAFLKEHVTLSAYKVYGPIEHHNWHRFITDPEQDRLADEGVHLIDDSKEGYSFAIPKGDQVSSLSKVAAHMCQVVKTKISPHCVPILMVDDRRLPLARTSSIGSYLHTIQSSHNKTLFSFICSQ